MGDPKKSKKTYLSPSHPWEKARIEDERVLKREYGFKNKKELWKSSTVLKNYLDRSKQFVARQTTQSLIEQEQMIEKLRAYGLLAMDGTLGDVLSIGLKDVLDRRLQTIVYKKGLSRTVKQARQFIVHGHVMVGERKITSPSYLVTLKEEGQLIFSDGSTLSDEAHPERITLVQRESQMEAEKVSKAKADAKKEKRPFDKGNKPTRKPIRKEGARK